MFKIRFEFQDRKPEDIDRVNEALSAMRLSDVRISDLDGYAAKVTQYFPETDRQPQISYRYGIDSLELDCEEDGEDGAVWQLDACVFPKDGTRDDDAFHDLWCREHPDRIMRSLRVYDFKDTEAFVVLHHGRRKG